MLETQIIILIILIFFSALFSGIETALISLNMIKVKSLVKQKKKGSAALYRMKQNPHRLIITILIGNNLVNIGAASLATIIFTGLFGSSGAGIATGIMTFLILVFGEITPKTLASQNAEKISLFVARPIEILSIIIFPIVKFFEIISRGVSKLFGSKKEKELSTEELEAIVTMGAKEGILDREAAKMMHNVLKFRGTKVTQIMVPEINIAMLDGKKKLKDIMEFIVKSPFSRYPIYLGNKHNIVGVLDVDDVLKYTQNKKLDTCVKNIARAPFFVPESKEIDDLLFEFEGKEIPLAIVVDEHGEISGMVTIEDVLEEIVGDIFDKSKKESVYIKKIDDQSMRVNAKVSIEEVNRVLRLGIKKEHFDTLSGFIQHKLKRIPKKGERMELKNVIIEVEKVTNQTIKTVKIIKK